MFLNKKEISYCIQQLKDIYPKNSNKNTINTQDLSKTNSCECSSELTSFALNSGKWKLYLLNIYIRK
jgi:hypothetical protein